MTLSDFTLSRVHPDYNVLPFDCGNPDLNEFLNKDAKTYLSELLAVTYLFESSDKVVAYFTLLNDNISCEAMHSNNAWRRIKNKFPLPKQFTNYPAAKVGRFAVDISLQRQGLGSEILDYVKGLLFLNNKTGCVFITVDAFQNSFDFYSKNGFSFLSNKDIGQATRLMYFDLRLLKV